MCLEWDQIQKGLPLYDRRGNMRFIWITHEGTTQIKESQISLLTHRYAVFKMDENETINAMYNRFNDIFVGLKGIGKTIGKAELNHKLLLSLQKEWRSKVTIVEEAKDVATMIMKEILGSLITYEDTNHTLHLQIKDGDQEEEGSHLEHWSQEEEGFGPKDPHAREDEGLNEEMALITRNFKMFFRKNIGANTLRRQEEEWKDIKWSKEKKEINKDKIECYKWKGFGYVRHECPTKDKDQVAKGRKFSKPPWSWVMMEMIG